MKCLLCKEDAMENNNGEVTPTHIMISILECGDGIGLRILLSLGIDLDLYNTNNKIK